MNWDWNRLIEKNNQEIEIARRKIAKLEQENKLYQSKLLEKKNDFTPNWFSKKWHCNCPKLTSDELKEYENTSSFGSEREENWNYDVIKVNRRDRR